MSGAGLAAMAAAQAASTIMQARGQKIQSEAQARAAEFNASVAQEKAGLQKAQTQSDVASQKREARARAGKAKAAAGGLGGVEGSVLDILASNAVQEELDILTLQQRGKVAEKDILTGARLDILEAQQARSGGGLASASSILGGVSKLTSGFVGSGGGG